MTDTGVVKQISGGKRHSLDGHEGFYREDLGTVQIAKEAARKLGRLGYPVHMTRHPVIDTNAKCYLRDVMKPTRWQRAHWSQSTYIRKYAKSLGGDMLVSIHTNGGGGTGCSGFYITPGGEALSETILANLNERLGLRIRRNKRKRYSVLKGVPVACLIECAFHDHPIDLAMLLSPVGRAHMGLSIAEAVDEYWMAMCEW
jgi:N-acetylmuramoyl-L-alanine amidase